MLFKKLFTTALTLTLSAQVWASATTLKVDSAATQLKWLGKKVTGQHDGTIQLKSGEVKLDKSQIVGGRFEIDMNSMTCADIKDAETNAKLLGHLKSDDFFSTAKHPVALFEIKAVKPLAKVDAKGNTHEISGDLTIKGVKVANTFPAKVEIKGDSLSAMGTVTIDRTAYGVKYGSGKFFQNLGDKMINDNFEITLALAAKK